MQFIKEVYVKKRKREKTYLLPDIIYDVETEINEMIDKGLKYPNTVSDYLFNNKM